MAKGYPTRVRARKAFERGVRDGFERRRAFNPYLHARLKALYERGLAHGRAGHPPLPLPLPAKVKSKQAMRSRAPQPRRWGGWR